MIKTLLSVTLFVMGISCSSLSSISTDLLANNDSETEIDELEAFAIVCEQYLKNPVEDNEPVKMARRLAREGKWDTINAIFASDRFNYFKTHLAWEIVSVSKSADAVAFLRTLSKGDNAWHMGMLSLKRDPIVKAYVLEVASDKDPAVRSTCYDVCREHHWPDLLEQARVDSTSTERYHPQMVVSCGLADDAKSYRVALGDLPKDTPIELPRVWRIPERPKGEPLFPPGPWESIKNLPNPGN